MSTRGRFQSAMGAGWRMLLALALINGAMVSPALAGQHGYKVLHHFDGRSGAFPGGLISGLNGSFYGSTMLGGGSGQTGTVFSINSAGKYTLMRAFSDLDFNGSYLGGELTWGQDGRLYGVASADGGGHCGTVFALELGGRVEVLHDFVPSTPNGPEGCHPEGGVAFASDGSLMGLTFMGGHEGRGLGSVFRVTTSWDFAELHSFGSTPIDGASPRPGGPPVISPEGVMYGVTTQGGAWDQGTLFAIYPGGAYQILHVFGGDDLVGGSPSALTMAADGRLYGVTTLGGAAGVGTVFRYDLSGRMKVLHAFVGGMNDGAEPVGRLLQASDGKFYGTTRAGGSANMGTVFQMSAGGKFKLLHAFNGGEDGRGPEGGLAQADSGLLYGTTRAGGAYDVGVVFSVRP